MAGVVGAVAIVEADGCGVTSAAGEVAGAAAGCGATALPAAGMARRTMVMPSRTGSMTCSIGVRAKAQVRLQVRVRVQGKG